MTDLVTTVQARRRRSSALLVSAVVIATLGTLALIVESSAVLGRMTHDLALAQPRVTNLSNSQREALRLSQALSDLGNESDVTDVTVRRALLLRQLTVSVDSFPAESRPSRELLDIQDAVARVPFDRLGEPGGETARVRRVGMANLSQSERRIKVLFDEQEKIFYSGTIGSLAAKQRSQLAIGILLCLEFAIGIGWMLMLKRRARSDVASAYAALLEEMRERRLLQDDLAHQAAHDPLTGLANRAQMLDLIQAALYRSQRSESLVGLLFVDLDYFKNVNDTLGHGAGDAVLTAAAERMRSLIRAGDVVGRLGGDEFVVLVEPLTVPTDLVELADRLIASVSEPFAISGREVTIGPASGSPPARTSTPTRASCCTEPMWRRTAPKRLAAAVPRSSTTRCVASWTSALTWKRRSRPVWTRASSRCTTSPWSTSPRAPRTVTRR